MIHADTQQQYPSLQSMMQGRQILSEVKLAGAWFLRLKGLLGSTCLLPHQGLLISPCNSIHTVAMQYALDAVFLAQDGTILKLVTNLRPWRGAGCLRASATLELAADSVAQLGLATGQRLTFAPNPRQPGYASVWRMQGQA